MSADNNINNDPARPAATSAGARRRLLRALTAGGSALAATALLREGWRSPVVKSVVLPAHAQTTGEIINGNFFVETTLAASTPGRNLLDMAVPRAVAGVKAAPLIVDGCVVVEDSVAAGCVFVNSVIVTLDGLAVPGGSAQNSDSDYDVTVELGGVSGTAPDRVLRVFISRQGDDPDFDDEPVDFPETNLACRPCET